MKKDRCITDRLEDLSLITRYICRKYTDKVARKYLRRRRIFQAHMYQRDPPLKTSTRINWKSRGSQGREENIS